MTDINIDHDDLHDDLTANDVSDGYIIEANSSTNSDDANSDDANSDDGVQEITGPAFEDESTEESSLPEQESFDSSSGILSTASTHSSDFGDLDSASTGLIGDAQPDAIEPSNGLSGQDGTANPKPVLQDAGTGVPPTTPQVDLIPGDDTTTATISIGQTIVSDLDVNGDRDWFRIDVVAGQRLQIDVGDSGGSTVDTFLRLYDANSNLLTTNDDGGPGLDSQLIVTAPTTGTYYISVGAFNDASNGEYTLSVSEPPPAPDLEGSQWHLPLLGDMEAIWADYTGTDVNVGIYDDGVQLTHFDLAPNYNASLEVSVGGVVQAGDAQDNGGVRDIAHGTAVAGLIASADNGEGTVGIAYNSTLTGVGIFDGPANINGDYNGFLEAAGQSTNFDLINHSWGRFPGFFQSSITSDQQLTDIWEDSLVNGRDGLGTIHIKSAGNDNANNNGASSYDASRATITVGGYGSDNEVYDNSSHGATLLVSAPTLGSTTNPGAPGNLALVTTDMIGADGYTSDDFANTTNGFSGTSGSAPIVSGVVALMLDANEGLGWRDVSNIISLSATEVGSALTGNFDGNENYSWRYNGATDWNGGGRHYSEDFGYGAINAYNAVRMAEVWNLFNEAQTSANEFALEGLPTSGNGNLVDNGVTNFTHTFIGFTGHLVEYINVNVDITHGDMNQLTITLVSPSGIRTDLFRGDVSGSQTNWTWEFGANGFRGEEVAGQWTIEILDGAIGLTGSADVTFDFYTSDPSAGADNDDVHHLTSEFSNAVADDNSRRVIADTDGGTDWINAAALAGRTIIDLRGATNSSFVDGLFATISGVENAVTGDGNDDIFGTGLRNELHGMRGDDELYGFGGADILFGGAGNDELYGGTANDTLNGGAGADFLSGGAGNDDMASYIGASTGMRIDLFLTGQSTGDAAGDIYASVENILGSGHNDVILGLANANDLFGHTGNDRLIGRGGDDRLFGGTGDDTLIGGLGADVLNGGPGNDTASYEFATAGVRADLISFGGNLGEAAGDSYFGIENLIGTSGVDTLLGDNGVNILRGLSSNDRLIGRDGADRLFGDNGNDALNGGLGADFLNGGAGSDTAAYDFAAAGLRVDMIFTGNNLGEAAGDQYVSIENLSGSSNRDVLLGNHAANAINGGGGNDLLFGRGGNDIMRGGNGADEIHGGGNDDRIYGGSGADRLYGEGGEDTFFFENNWGSDRIFAFEDNVDTIDFSMVAGITSLSDLSFSAGAGFTLIDYSSGTGWTGTIQVDGVTEAQLTNDFVFV